MSTTSPTTTSKSAKAAEASWTALSAAFLILCALATAGCPEYVETETPPGQVPPPARSELIEDAVPAGGEMPRLTGGAAEGVALAEGAAALAKTGALSPGTSGARGTASDGKPLLTLGSDD